MLFFVTIEGPTSHAETTHLPSTGVIPYQGRAIYSNNVRLWREGNLIVSFRDVPLPTRCVKCNAPAVPDWRYRQTLYWHHPAYYALLLIGLLPGLSIILYIRERTDVNVGLCPRHKAHHTFKITIRWTLMGIALLLFAFGLFISDSQIASLYFWIALEISIVSLAWLVFMVPVIRVKQIVKGVVWFKGGGAAFLDSLPEQPPSGG